MIQLSGAGKRFGHKLLFQNADWLITAQDRIGLVGANGTGKSTLMKILGGLETLDYGSITVAKGINAGYLPQDGLTLSGRTVFAECMSVFDELRDMEREMEELTRRMSELSHESSEYAQVADRYHRLEHEFQTRDGYAIEAKVGTVLTGLGFRKEDWGRLTDEFSGGWQMRIALAKLLLQKPNLLLLDEPTNHLDLEARNWLEEYLNQYPYAFVLIITAPVFLINLPDLLIESGGLGRFTLRPQPVVVAAAAHRKRPTHLAHAMLRCQRLHCGIPFVGASERMPHAFFRMSRWAVTLASCSRRRRFSASRSCVVQPGGASARPAMRLRQSRSETGEMPRPSATFSTLAPSAKSSTASRLNCSVYRLALFVLSSVFLVVSVISSCSTFPPLSVKSGEAHLRNCSPLRSHKSSGG